jgi:hypothetical protein
VRHCIVGLVFLSLVSVATATPPQQLKLGINEVSVATAKGTFRLQLVLDQEQLYPNRTSQGIWGIGPNDGDHRPGPVIVSMKAWLDGETLVTPASSYLDLFDPRTIVLRAQKSKITAVIEGSQTGERYFARIEFGQYGVTARRVASAEVPKDSFEETQYHYLKE